MAHEPKRKIIADLSSVSRRDLIQKLGPAAGVFLAGCSGGGSDGDGTETSASNGTPSETEMGGTDVTPGGTLNAGLTPGIYTMDGRSVTGLRSMQVIYNIHSKLLRWKREGDDLVLVGDLATDWEYEDETTLTLELNEDAVFHNGEPVTAEDVAYTFRTMQEEATYTASILFTSDLNVEAVDEHTVTFDAGSQPMAALEANLGFIVGIVSKKADQEQNLSRQPVGSGPFQFDEWVDGDHVYIEKFDDYWKTDDDGNELPYLDRIEFDILPEDSTKMNNFQSGNLDWIGEIPRRDVANIVDNDDFKTETTGPGGLSGVLQFNTTEPPFNDPNIRKAVLYAVDWEPVIQTVFFDTAERANNQPLPPRTGWNVDVEDPYAEVDVERAEELLENAEEDPNTEFANWERSGDPVLRTQEIMLEQLSNKLGMEFELNGVEGDVASQKTQENDFGFTLGSFQGMYDPDQILTPIFEEGAFFNFGNYNDPEIQDLLVEGRQTSNRDERLDIYSDLVSEYSESGGTYFPYWEHVYMAMHPYVNSFSTRITNMWFFEQVWMAQ